MKSRNYNFQRKLTVLSALFFLFSIIGCKKFLEVAPPPTQPDAAVVYSNDATATSVLSGLYANFRTGGILIGNSGISQIAGLSADELTTYPGAVGVLQVQAYQNDLQKTNTPFWVRLYSLVYITNTAINNINASSKLSPAVKQQLLGEAKFMRAYFYFYLVNLWGDVPLITSTAYQANELAARSPKTQVWQQIIQDLKDAQGLLSKNFVALDLKTITTERVRPNYWAATALLARAYLYEPQPDYANAAIESSAVIANNSLFSILPLNNVFLANSNEAIWQLQPDPASGYNTPDAQAFVLTAPPNYAQPTSISPQLLNAFEPGDQRKVNWISSFTKGSKTYFYPFKYKVYVKGKPVTEYTMVLRLAEQFLIRAEAEANGAGGGVAAAVNDLNIIRNRGGLPNYSGATDAASLQTAILQERQVELFTEWGFRWLDLKRTKQVDPVMSVVTPLKGGAWNTNWQLYPISVYDITKDYNLTQNPGY